MSNRELIIEGVKQNNLKDISLSLPHNKIIAVTGVSGSGKSSLAFDTIFAEGQWRFIESLSTYARLFLEKLDRPDVEAIRNIRPAIALEQKNPIKGSRSTVGTLTDIYDLLRILYSRIALPYCPKCKREIRKWDTSQIAAEILEKYSGEKAVVIFESEDAPETLKARGFQRVWLNNDIIDISEVPENFSGTLGVVLDRLVISNEPRLTDSIESAWKEGRKRVKVIIFEPPEEPSNSAGGKPSPAGNQPLKRHLRFSSKNTCDYCNISLPEPTPIFFSFNHPVCACSECKGFGNILIYDEELVVPDKSLSLAGGAIELWEKPGYKWWKEQMIKGAKKSGVNINKPYKNLPDEDRDALYKGTEHFRGINTFFEEMENKRYKLHIRILLSRYRSPKICPKCKGKRLSSDALSYKIDGIDIAEAASMSIAKLSGWLKNLELSPMQRDIANEPVRQILLKLHFLERVGLDYLTLKRQAKTLSGGEYQRVSLSNQMASALTGTLYVLDEPTVGLHPRDTKRIAGIMRELASRGNTIIVVEHDRDIISMSDWVVELGPGGGHLGGEVVFSGDMENFLKSGTLTAQYIRGCGSEQHPYGGLSPADRQNSKDYRLRTADYSLTLKGVTGNNLKNVTLRLPLEALSVVTGVSGSGKSSLIVETLYYALTRHFRIEPEQPLPYKTINGVEKIKGVRLIDQTPIGKTPRSNLLTYLKIFDSIRKLFSLQPEAKAHGYTPGFFSFNIPGGRCETCSGEGYQKLEMFFFEDVFVKCEDCKGRRYKNEALKVKYKGKNISEVLEMTVDEAFDFFYETAEIKSTLEMMKDIGLGYLKLGQPATTFSGGEAQRLKICAELSANSRPLAWGTLYILDEPTVGLHHSDVMMFMKIVRKLVETGNTVVIIEHNLDVIRQSDWVIDLGPEGGELGGAIIFEGTPAELINAANSHTGSHLKEYEAGLN